MKHQGKIWQNMMLSLAIIIGAGSLTACNQSENAATNLSNEEVAIVLEGALSNGTQGISSEVNDLILLTQQYAQKSVTNQYCGQSFDSTVVRNIDETRITASYTATWKWKVNCNNLRIPTSLDFNRTSNGTYATARISSDDNAGSNWSIGNLLTGTAYTLNGTYTREGSQTTTIRNQNSFTSQVNISVNSLSVNKNTLRIDSGTATFTLSGSGTDGNNFSYQGNIVFNGNGSATVTINGETFDIQL
ncbi:MAG: hypothetical protein ACK4TA_12785 [Saprospiraceae bacterium]